MKNENELKLIQKAGYHFAPEGSMVAGGAVTSAFTGQPINDVDLYFKSRRAFECAVASAYDEGLWCVHKTSRAVTFAYGDAVVQLVHFDWFSDAHAVFDAFDFTCCMGAFDNDAKEFVFHDNFLKHASQRYLSFHAGSRFPFGSLLRVMKYQARGYTIGKGDMLRIALACHKTPVASWTDLSEQIGGQYGERINLEGIGDFSIESAIEAIAKSSPFIASKAETMPGSSDELLALIFNDNAEKDVTP
jgi:hypothetical protein